MYEFSPAEHPRVEAELPTDLVAGLLMEKVRQPRAVAGRPDRLPLKVYGVMTVTTLMTFTTLVSGYQLLFTHQLFA